MTRPGLLLRSDGQGPSLRILAEPRVIIGRSPTAGLVLEEASVSRRHAEVFEDALGRFWIRDLGSTNGTFVNGRAVSEHALEPLDRIALGDCALVFHVHDQDARASAEAADDPPTVRTLLDFETPRLAATHLFTLMDLGKSLVTLEDAPSRRDALCRLLVRGDFHGRHAGIVRVKNGAATTLAGPLVASRARLPAPALPSHLLAAIVENGGPLLSVAFEAQSGSAATEAPLSVAVCPLAERAGEVEVLYVTLPAPFGNAEWLALVALAADVHIQAEAAWSARRRAVEHAAIERELGMARQIQRALVPGHVDFAALDVALRFEPCRSVGGDYVDAISLPDGRTLLVVADVCGKGLQAALVTSSLHAVIHESAVVSASPARIVEKVNEHLCAFLPSHSFVTMICVALDAATGAVECINAGHPPAVLLSSSGIGPTYLQAAKNPPLGVGHATLETQETRLERGDVLAMFTDGLTELETGPNAMLGLTGLVDCIDDLVQGNARATAGDLARDLLGVLEARRGERPPDDDCAFLFARRL